MKSFQDLIIRCKDDLQRARNARDEAAIQIRVQNGIIESLLDNLGRLEEFDRESKKPLQAK